MPERTEKLRQTLVELENELHDLDTLDDEARKMLQEVSREINTLLERAEPHPHASSVQNRLNESIESFEVAHPTLAGVVRRLIDGLGQMGI
jgi:chromosome segregation ATPase